MPQGLKLLDSAQEGWGKEGKKKGGGGEIVKLCSAQERGLGWVHTRFFSLSPSPGVKWSWGGCLGCGWNCTANVISGVGSCPGLGLSVCNACAQLPWMPTPELHKIPIQADFLPTPPAPSTPAAEPGMS